MNKKKEIENNQNEDSEIKKLMLAALALIIAGRAAVGYSLKQPDEFCGNDRSGYNSNNHPECVPSKTGGQIHFPFPW